MAHPRALLLSRPDPSPVPGQGLPVPTGAVHVLRAGSSLLAYAPRGEAFDVDTTALPGSALRGWWFDPATGTAIDAGSVRRDPAVTFFPPQTVASDAGRDWVLVIDDAARGLGPPGSASALAMIPRG